MLNKSYEFGIINEERETGKCEGWVFDVEF